MNPRDQGADGLTATQTLVDSHAIDPQQQVVGRDAAVLQLARDAAVILPEPRIHPLAALLAVDPVLIPCRERPARLRRCVPTTRTLLPGRLQLLDRDAEDARGIDQVLVRSHVALWWPGC